MATHVQEIKGGVEVHESLLQESKSSNGVVPDREEVKNLH